MRIPHRRMIVMSFVVRPLTRALILVLILAVNSYGQSPPTLAEIQDLATTLVTLQSQQEREQLLDKNKTLVTPELRKALITQGNTQLLAGRYSTALNISGI